MNVALIAAGGRGERMMMEIPKQFIHVYDKPLIIYTLKAFQEHPSIDAILVVCLDGWHDVLRACAKQFGITKLKWIAAGGASLQESVGNGLSSLHGSCANDDIVLIHDANRPLVTSDVISDSLAVATEKGCAVPIIPCEEVMLVSHDGLTSSECLDRSVVKRTQTPQAFRYGKILALYDKALELKRNAIAPCDLMIQLGEAVFFSTGSKINLKITTHEDLEILKALLQAKAVHNHV